MDVIVVGGGIGGLTLGALLAAQDRKKVLLLEAQEQIGGFAREFQGQSGTVFDMGALQMGAMHPGSRLRSVLDSACGRALPWRSLNFELEKYVFAEDEFSVPASRTEFKQRLKQRFPQEAVGIEEYFASIKKTAAAYLLWQMCETFPAALSMATKIYLRCRRPQLFRTTARQLNLWFQSEQLKEILWAPWSGYGISPKKSSFGYHCLHVDHHMGGAWYPENGLGEISKALAQSIQAAGGEIRTSTRVSQIMVKNGKAIGVRLANGSEILAGTIVSNAGVEATYRHLLPAPYTQVNLNLSEESSSAVMLCLDLKASPSVIGLTASNYRLNLGDETPMLLTLTSLKRQESRHSAQVVVLCDKSVDEERALTIRNQALQRLEEKFPGFQSLLGSCQLIPPSTFTRWHSGSTGAIFGLPPLVERLNWRWTRSRTPVQNLYLTGSDVLGPGFGSAMMGALKTYELLQGGLTWRTAWRTMQEVGQFADGELA